MKNLLILSAALLLAACQSQDLGAYNHELAHPYKVAETVVRMPLANVTPEQAAQRAQVFAGDRPNNGSTFIVAAPTELAFTVRAALMRMGVQAQDVRLVPEAQPAEIVRTDRIASVEGCNRPPEPRGLLDYMFHNEEGFDRANANPRVFGCSVRRNIGAMVDDPRSLEGATETGARDGISGARVYGKYSKGEMPAATVTLPSLSTSTAGGGSQ